MDDDYISIQNGDEITVAKNSDGDLAVKIENKVWVEQPRWIHVSVAGDHDRTTAINNLIYALEQLRDNPKA